MRISDWSSDVCSSDLLAISIIDRAKIEVIAGLNLPMLIKLASVRNTEKLADSVTAAREAGRKYINVASQLLACESRRSADRRVGQEGVRTCRSWWAPYQ